MKLQLEVTHVDPGALALTFKPINCSLQGDRVYHGIPRRAVEQFKKGQIVEATIPLPDHYPVKDSHEKPDSSEWQPINTAPKDGSFVFLRFQESPTVYARWAPDAAGRTAWFDERHHPIAHKPIYWKRAIPIPNGAFPTQLLGDKWYKRSPEYPYNWEPIQVEIQEACKRVLETGQPQVIACCGYVSVEREFIPYIRF